MSTFVIHAGDCSLVNSATSKMSSSASNPRSWVCPLCHHFAARTLKGIVRHVGAVHSFEANFHIKCGLEGCPRTYTNYHGYRKHLYTKHRDLVGVQPNPHHQSADPQLDAESETDFNELSQSSEEVPRTQRDEVRQSALFLLKNTAVNKVSKSSLNDLIGDVSIFLSEQVQSLQSTQVKRTI